MNNRVGNFWYIKRRRSFETAVVVMLVGILFGSAALTGLHKVNAVRVSEAFSLLGAYQLQLRLYIDLYGRWPDSIAELNEGLSDEVYACGMEDLVPAGKQTHFVNDVELVNKSLHFRLRKVLGSTLSFRSISASNEDAAPFAWTCAGHRVASGLHARGENRTDILTKNLPAICW